MASGTIPLPQRSGSLAHRLRDRSFLCKLPHQNLNAFRHERHNNYCLRGVIEHRGDCNDTSADASPIHEILAINDLILVLNRTGHAAAYHRHSLTLLRTLNLSVGDDIRSIFYNALRQELMLVSIDSAGGSHSMLHPRCVPVTAISHQPVLSQSLYALAHQSLLTSEQLSHPGFVEFDDLNKIILSFSANTNHYRIWSLSQYQCQWSMLQGTIKDVKLSPGMLLCIHHRNAVNDSLLLQILNIKNGQSLFSYTYHQCPSESEMEYIELFNQRLFIKLANRPLLMVDIVTQASLTVDDTVFPKPSQFIFLYYQNLIMTLFSSGISIYDSKTRMLFERLAKTRLFGKSENNSTIFINKTQTLIITYNRDSDSESRRDGCILMHEVRSGKLLGAIHARDESFIKEEDVADTCTDSDGGINGMSVDVLTDASVDSDNVVVDGSEVVDGTGLIRMLAEAHAQIIDLNSELIDYHTNTGTDNDTDTRRSSLHPDNNNSECLDNVDNRRTALTSLRCLCFNEQSNDIITGNSAGQVFVWSPR